VRRKNKRASERDKEREEGREGGREIETIPLSVDNNDVHLFPQCV
jgi:hypothetical protein